MATKKVSKSTPVPKSSSKPSGKPLKAPAPAKDSKATKTISKAPASSASSPKKASAPAKKPAPAPAKKPAAPAKKPAPAPAKKPAPVPAKKPAASAKKPAPAPAKKPAPAPAKKPAAAAKKPAPGPAKKPAPAPAKKPAEPAKKPAPVPAKKPAPAPVKKAETEPVADGKPRRDKFGHFIKAGSDATNVEPPKRDAHGHFIRTNPVHEPFGHTTKNLPEPARIAPPPVIHPALPGTKKLVQSEIQELRGMLIADREQLLRVVNHLHHSSLAQSEGINLEEDGTELSSQIFGLNSAADAEDRIRQIDEALRAIDAGTYGYCTICGNMINPARLRALPSAKTCIRCQSEAENKNNGRIFVRGRI